MNYENLPVLQEYLYALASAEAIMSPPLAKDIRELAYLLDHIPHALPNRGVCPHCRAHYLVNDYRPERRGIVEVQVFEMRVVKRLCAEDQEYHAGYRAIWRCRNCGEIEIR